MQKQSKRIPSKCRTINVRTLKLKAEVSKIITREIKTSAIKMEWSQQKENIVIRWDSYEKEEDWWTIERYSRA